MKPTSFSATSLQAAEGCLSRYHAEFIERGRGPAGSAATTGLICHEALEHFLRGTQIKKDVVWSRTELDRIFNEAYEKVVGPDRSKPEYSDAYQLVLKWFNAPGREDYFKEAKIMSLEAKNSFPLPLLVPNAHGVVEKVDFPVNYIMDRVDRLPDNEFRVIDYKTNWVPLTYDQLRMKIQARLYALAMQILYKDAKRIWVMFDFLRHEPVEIALTKADQVETWNMLKRAGQRIIDTSDRDAQRAETINPDCLWCVKKSTCGALKKNAAVGGIHSLSVSDKAKRFAETKSQIKALEVLGSELEAELLKELIHAQTIDLDEEEVRVRLKRSSRRTFDQRAVADILGPEILSRVGTVTLKALDDLRKSGQLTVDQCNKIDELISIKMGDPGIEVSIKK